MLSKLALPVGIVALSSAAAVWMYFQQQAPSLEDPEPPVLLVDVIAVEPVTVNMQVRANGTVTPLLCTHEGDGADPGLAPDPSDLRF